MVGNGIKWGIIDEAYSYIMQICGSNSVALKGLNNAIGHSFKNEEKSHKIFLFYGAPLFKRTVRFFCLYYNTKIVSMINNKLLFCVLFSVRVRKWIFDIHCYFSNHRECFVNFCHKNTIPFRFQDTKHFHIAHHHIIVVRSSRTISCAESLVLRFRRISFHSSLVESLLLFLFM